MHLVEGSNSTFTTQELQRLAAYRAAIAAGFYTDWDGSAETTDTETLAWLRAPAADEPNSNAAAAYPFTDAERLRLERCKAAVAAGYYSDDAPPSEASATLEDSTR
jgi:hypothetical protein